MGLRCYKPKDTWGYQKLKTRKDPGKEGQGPANMLTVAWPDPEAEHSVK